jgi:hypothetical protein
MTDARERRQNRRRRDTRTNRNREQADYRSLGKALEADMKAYNTTDAVLEIVADAIKSQREGILRGREGQAARDISAYDNGQLIVTVYLAKDIAKKLPTVEKQREFLTMCGLPDATL